MFIFTILIALLLESVNCKNYTNCSAIDGKIVPTAADLLNGSPWFYYWGIQNTFQCAQFIFAKPRKGYDHYFGSMAVTNLLNNDAMVIKFIRSDDGKSLILTNCSVGCVTPTIIKFNLVAYQKTKKGSFHCWSVCDDAAFNEFICISNVNIFGYEMKQVVDSMRTVPNGNNIRLLQDGCPNCQQCSFLNG